MIGYYRETNFDITYKGDLPNQWNLDMEYSGKQKGLILITRSIQFFLLITMIFPVFFGTYWFGNNFWLNLLVICGINLIIVFIMALAGRGKPRILLDRKIQNWIRTPHIFAFLALIWALILPFL